MSKRVLFVSYTAGSTGPTNSLMLLLKHLPKRIAPSVLLPSNGPFAEALARENIPYFIIPNLTKWSIPAIIRLIRRERFQLVYGNNDSSSSRNSLIASRLARVPFIGHVREMGWGKSWRYTGYLRFADAVVGVSEACAASMAKFVPEAKMNVVHNGVELEAVSETERETARAAILEELSLPPDSVIVISMGHISARKGTKYSIEATFEALKSAPNIRLLLFGSMDADRAYAGEVQTLIRERGLEDKVFLLGYREDASQLLPGADVFSHSALADPHPRVVIEAMAAHLPVVAFSTDGVTETIEDGKTGYLVPTENTEELSKNLLKLSLDSKLRDKLGKAGRVRAEACFTASATAEQIAVIIDKTLNKAKR